MERREAPAFRQRSAALTKTGAPLGAPSPRLCEGEKGRPAPPRRSKNRGDVARPPSYEASAGSPRTRRLASRSSEGAKAGLPGAGKEYGWRSVGCLKNEFGNSRTRGELVSPLPLWERVASRSDSEGEPGEGVVPHESPGPLTRIALGFPPRDPPSPTRGEGKRRRGKRRSSLIPTALFLNLRGFRPSAISDSLARGGFAPFHQR